MSETPTPTLEAWNPAKVYKYNDPRGWCGDPSRGAAMGRRSFKDIPEDCDFKGFTIHVEHILIVDGYDPNGTYFGNGGPLFWVYALEIGCTRPDGSVDHEEPAYLDYCERFVDLEDAVRIVRETWPHARVIGSEAWCDELVEKYLDEEYERETQDTDFDSYEDMSLVEFLEECVIKPPSMPIASWNKMIERARALEARDVEETEE